MTGAGAALAACAAPAAPAASDSGEEMPAAEAAMLRVQAPAGNGALMPREFATRFMDETGVQVEVEGHHLRRDRNEDADGLHFGHAAGPRYGHHRWIFINFLKGIYLEIDDLLDTAPPDDFDDFYPSVLEGNQWEGKNFSLPDVVHPGGNIAVNYNKTMLEEKGLPEPQLGWTISDWTELARAAADPDARRLRHRL